MKTPDQTRIVEFPETDVLVVDLGDAADLTRGGPGPGREDKRYEVG